MTGFPKLIPAFTAQIPITAPSAIGTLRSGGLVHVGFIPDQGFIKSEPGYPIAVDAVFTHGSDYIRADPDGRQVRLDVNSLLKDKTSGGFLNYNYTGIVKLGGPAGKVLTDSPDAKTTDFGEAFTHVTFESGDPALKALGDNVYVASGRFILEEGKPVIVEYKISEVAA